MNDPSEIEKRVMNPTAKQRVQAASWALLAVLAVCLVGMMALLVYLAVIDHQRIRQNEQIQDFIQQQAIVNGKYGEELRDCVRPGGDCFERQAASTSRTIAQINEYSVGASFCAATIEPPILKDNGAEYDRFLECIERYVKMDGNVAPAS